MQQRHIDVAFQQFSSGYSVEPPLSPISHLYTTSHNPLAIAHQTDQTLTAIASVRRRSKEYAKVHLEVFTSRSELSNRWVAGFLEYDIPKPLSIFLTTPPGKTRRSFRSIYYAIPSLRDDLSPFRGYLPSLRSNFSGFNGSHKVG